MMGKIKLLLYCTKQKPYLIKNYDDKYIVLNKLMAWDSELNGKIVAECDFEVEEIRGEIITGICGWISPSKYDWCFDKDLLDKSRLTNDMLCDYLENGTGYAIHIKNLNIFDKPRELSRYMKREKGLYIGEFIKKAPQNMMYCEDTNDELYILISIRPEWLCKILNGEKTIEVRKKVLKEMI